MIRMLMWFALFLTIASPAGAQTPPQVPVSTQLSERAATLLTLLRDGAADPAAFAPAFVEQVPLDRLTAVAVALRKENGAVMGIDAIAPDGPNRATVRISYEQAVVTARVALEPSAPHRLIGLLVIGVTRRDDSIDKIVADLRALPGTASLLVAQLGQGASTPVVDYQSTTPLATGSQFKLFVLAELARQVTAGERRWSDVVPLGPPSLPSGVMQTWPKGVPATLSTLATQMISISDNTAADTLLTSLGRDKVDALRLSVGNTPGSLPVLSTREAFVLKMTRSAALRERWTKGTLAERRALLATNDWPLVAVDPVELVGAPQHIRTVEWPATVKEIAAVLDLLRRSGPHALDILAVSPGLPRADRDRFAYVGYKGGSESGVVALAWLLRTRDGRAFAVTGAWNDATAPVDIARFTSLMTRAVALVR